MVSDASVKIRIDGESKSTASDGNGPVECTSYALRKALFNTRDLQTVHLSVIKCAFSTAKTAPARVRVSSSFIDGERRWSTVGASTNIIEASATMRWRDSWYALQVLNGN